MNIAYLKETTDGAEAYKHIHADAELVQKESLHDASNALQNDQCNALLCVIESAKTGTNYELYDMLHSAKNLHIVAEFIPNNTHAERFVLVSKTPNKPEDSNKASLMFVVSHKPGSLYNALAVFENYGLNLTKIESRRMYEKSYQYIFYVDFTYTEDQLRKMDEILAVYRENTQHLQIAGLYQS